MTELWTPLLTYREKKRAVGRLLGCRESSPKQPPCRHSAGGEHPEGEQDHRRVGEAEAALGPFARLREDRQKRNRERRRGNRCAVTMG